MGEGLDCFASLAMTRDVGQSGLGVGGGGWWRGRGSRVGLGDGLDCFAPLAMTRGVGQSGLGVGWVGVVAR